MSATRAASLRLYAAATAAVGRYGNELQSPLSRELIRSRSTWLAASRIGKLPGSRGDPAGFAGVAAARVPLGAGAAAGVPGALVPGPAGAGSGAGAGAGFAGSGFLFTTSPAFL